MGPSRLSWLRRIAVTTVVAFTWLAPGASAYWSSTGEAGAAANVATLSAPTISSATSGAETVELTWSAVTAPGTGTVEYYVSRDGGAPGAGCPSSSARSTATSCTDTGVPIGTYEYTITAVWRTWTATSTAKSATIAFGPATHLQLEASSVTPLAGEADNLTITAKDASNNTVGTYSGSHSLIFEGGTEAPNGTKPIVTDKTGVEKKLTEATEVTFAEGRATVSGSNNGVMKLYKAEATHIKVSDGALNNGAGLAVTVTAASSKKFTVPTPVEQTAGTAFNVTLTATDEWGNKTIGYTGVKTLVWSGALSSPSGQAPGYPSTATTVTFAEGVGTATAITLYDAVSTRLTATEGTVAGTSAAFTVKAIATTKKFTVTTPVEQTAGTAFSVTLTATDEWGNKTVGYTGAKTLAWSGALNSPSGLAPSYPTTATKVTFAEGVGTATTITLYDALSTMLTAKEGTTIAGTSGAFTVKAGAANSFSVPAPTEREAGIAFNVTVTAWDKWRNTATSYTGPKTLVWSGPSNSPSGQAPGYPSTATAVTFTEGVGTATAITLYDAQSTTLKATEGTVAGTSAAFTVKAIAITKKFTVTTPGEQTAGTAFSVTLTATDEWGNKTVGYTGAKTLVWTGALNSPSGLAPSYPTTATKVTFAEGVGTATTITLYDALSTTLTATEGTVAGTSPAFTVKAGASARLAFTTSPSTPTVENKAFATQPVVTVQDTWQNTATTDKSEVTLTSSGATLTCTLNPKAATAGVVKFAGCKINTAGTYTLKAADGILTSALSSSFTIS